jgi:hypothetical protein
MVQIHRKKVGDTSKSTRGQTNHRLYAIGQLPDHVRVTFEAH